MIYFLLLLPLNYYTCIFQMDIQGNNGWFLPSKYETQWTLTSNNSLLFKYFFYGTKQINLFYFSTVNGFNIYRSN